ncbi:MAG: VOC family protein [Candidatus Zixiibacteriota bacterium]|nr:MAG: VOC family protein [candidate division Zixibacteria bacterium]
MTKRPPKSEGMAWLNPYMIVRDVRRSLEFYEQAFGFTTRMTMPDKDGSIMHAEMAYRDNVLMIGTESQQQQHLSAQTMKGSPVSFYLYVDNVDDFFRKASQAAAEVIAEPKDQFWGDRTCTLKCPEGYQWTFAQNVADFDPNNIPG